MDNLHCLARTAFNYAVNALLSNCFTNNLAAHFDTIFVNDSDATLKPPGPPLTHDTRFALWQMRCRPMYRGKRQWIRLGQPLFDNPHHRDPEVRFQTSVN